MAERSFRGGGFRGGAWWDHSWEPAGVGVHGVSIQTTIIIIIPQYTGGITGVKSDEAPRADQQIGLQIDLPNSCPPPSGRLMFSSGKFWFGAGKRYTDVILFEPFQVPTIRLREVFVFWTVDERFDVERQVMRAICHEIARGAWSSGEVLPSPHVLAKQRILNPRMVESAYAKFVASGLLTLGAEGDYRPSDDARQRARDCLLQWAGEEARTLAGALRHAGLSREDIQRVFQEAHDA